MFLFTKLLISFRVSPYCGWCLDPSPKHRSTLNYGFWPGVTACSPDFSRLCTVFVQCILCHETLQVSRKYTITIYDNITYQYIVLKRAPRAMTMRHQWRVGMFVKCRDDDRLLGAAMNEFLVSEMQMRCHERT